jgi:hypothetical protein
MYIVGHVCFFLVVALSHTKANDSFLRISVFFRFSSSPKGLRDPAVFSPNLRVLPLLIKPQGPAGLGSHYLEPYSIGSLLHLKVCSGS